MSVYINPDKTKVSSATCVNYVLIHNLGLIQEVELNYRTENSRIKYELMNSFIRWLTAKNQTRLPVRLMCYLYGRLFQDDMLITCSFPSFPHKTSKDLYNTIS